MSTNTHGQRIIAAETLVDIAIRRGITYGTVAMTVKMQDGKMVHNELETKEINKPN